MTYLDNAAATPLDPAVAKAMQPYWQQAFYNPSASYLVARAVAKDVNDARARVAQLLGARPTDVVFTAGGTEADNLAIHGVMEAYPQANLVVSAIEHEAILQAAAQYPNKLAPVGKTGHLDIAKLAKLINDQTVLVSIMYANNELGTIQPITQVGQLVHKIRQDRQKRGVKLPLYFHTDASQAGNYLNLQVNRLRVDLMTLNGGKIYGPKQTGALYVKAGLELQPLIRGGGQERRLRSGTENVPGIIGFAKALELAQAQRAKEAERLQTLQADFEKQLQKAIPSIVINSQGNRLPNFVHITVPGHDNETLMMQLDEQGIQSAVGSACSASNEDPSHVLKAIGLTDEAAQSSLRFSMGRQTTKADVTKTAKSLQKLVTKK